MNDRMTNTVAAADDGDYLSKAAFSDESKFHM
jgi:hypothetical protein